MRTVQQFALCAFIGAILAGCSQQAPSEEAAVETPPTAAAELLKQVADAMKIEGGGEGLATLFFESKQALSDANPGKEKQIAELHMMFEALQQDPANKPRLLPQIQSKLQQLQ